MILDKLEIEVTIRECVLRKDKYSNSVVWIANFSIYKAHLLSYEKVFIPPVEQFCFEVKWYAPLFGILQRL